MRVGDGAVVRLGLRVALPACFDVTGERADSGRSELTEHPDRGRKGEERNGRDALRRPDCRSDAEPVLDPRVVRVEGRQDHVHVQECGDREGDVREKPAPRRRSEDRPDRDEREQVSLVDAGRQNEERDGEDGQRHEKRQRRWPPGNDNADDRERGDQKDATEDYGGDGTDHDRIGADRAAGQRSEDDRIARPRPVGGDPPPVERGERPGVVGVHARVGVFAGGVEHLEQQAGLDREAAGRVHLEDRQPEWEAEDDRGRQPDETGRDDPDRSVCAPFPGPESGGDSRRFRDRSFARIDDAGTDDRDRRAQGAADRDDRDDRNEDRELRLDERGNDREYCRPLRSVVPQRPKAQQQEDDAEGVDLTPEHRIEPADGVQHDQRGADERGSPTDADLARHRPHEPADRDVREDRRDLDQVADLAGLLPDQADQPQDVEVAGRVIVEERPLVEARQALGREIVRPELERREVDLEA